MNAACRSVLALAVAVSVGTPTPLAFASPDDEVVAGAAPAADHDSTAATDEPPIPADGPPEAETPAQSAAEPESAATPTPWHEPTQRGEEETRRAAAAAFLEGSKSYELGQYARAIELFETSWRLSHEPLLLFNLGQAHRKFFDVDPDIEHLRRARVFFENYDKRMRSSPTYNDNEVREILRGVDRQITDAETHGASMFDRQIRAREEAQRRQLWLDRERRTARGLNASGITLITLGSLSLTMGVAGVLTRTANKLVLDQTTDGPRGVNLASAADDRRRRDAYLTGGQIAFSGFIIGAVLLPVGITLKVLGGVRERRALGRKDGRKAQLSVGPDGTLFGRF